MNFIMKGVMIRNIGNAEASGMGHHPAPHIATQHLLRTCSVDANPRHGTPSV
ncbi:hypothetical protein [Burkholderia sp. LS-044]|uniref:hypothetical protein n=1 Tax=Burkholderia sp. LS-044 TaxID=1459967 RepID=UPI0014560466|nr:hypothetical protein [Burkholderia sp. LS-044]